MSDDLDANRIDEEQLFIYENCIKDPCNEALAVEIRDRHDAMFLIEKMSNYLTENSIPSAILEIDSSNKRHIQNNLLKITSDWNQTGIVYLIFGEVNNNDAEYYEYWATWMALSREYILQATQHQIIFMLPTKEYHHFHIDGRQFADQVSMKIHIFSPLS